MKFVWRIVLACLCVGVLVVLVEVVAWVIVSVQLLKFVK